MGNTNEPPRGPPSTELLELKLKVAADDDPLMQRHGLMQSPESLVQFRNFAHEHPEVEERSAFFCTRKLNFDPTEEITVVYGNSYKRTYSTWGHAGVPLRYEVPADPCLACKCSLRRPPSPQVCLFVTKSPRTPTLKGRGLTGLTGHVAAPAGSTWTCSRSIGRHSSGHKCSSRLRSARSQSRGSSTICPPSSLRVVSGSTATTRRDASRDAPRFIGTP